MIVWDTVWGRFSIEYSDAVLAAFVLAVVAVCWARGGMLVVRTSDSGNRVLLTAVPLIVFAIALRLAGGCGGNDNGENGGKVGK